MPRYMLTRPMIKSPHVTVALVDNETILLEMISQTYISLNSIGAKMWSLFDRHAMSTLDLAEYLQVTHHREAEQSIQEARYFVEGLLANALVYWTDE